MKNHTSGAAFFVTQNGFVGLCTPLVEVHDQLAIWFGSPVPFVLRALGPEGNQASSNTYALIGAAYVSGIMNGEMVDELYCEDLIDSTTFYIK
jgi:hypothetical protein